MINTAWKTITLRLYVKGRELTVKADDLDTVLSSSLEYIGLINRQLMYNISSWLYEDYQQYTDEFFEKGKFTFCKDVYIVEI